MAKIVFAMNQSLDGYVDHDKFEPDAVLFRHFIDKVGGLAGSVYGKRLYGLMRYWDEQDPQWTPALQDFALAWRRQPKWVVSQSLHAVGPNATLVQGDLASFIRGLKADVEGNIEIGGPVLAASLTELGLIDEYQLYVHPVVLGGGTPFFLHARPPLRLVASEAIGESVMHLTYVPA